MQETSFKAFINEVAPTLGARQIRVLECFETGDELTNMEIARRLDWEINRVTPRVFELREQKILEEAVKRECRITGRTAIAWRIKQESPKPAAAPAPTHYQFRSKSDPYQAYKVAEKDGRVLCNCPGFHYRGRCAHVKQVQTFVDQHRVSRTLF